MLRKFSRHFRANVVAYIALFFALGSGSAYASHLIVRSSDIVDNEVRTADVRDDNLTGGGLLSRDVRPDALTGSDVRALNGGDVNDNSLTGADVDESTLGKVPDADKLDGMEPSQLPGGVASITPIHNFPGIPFDLGTSTTSFKFVGEPETGITTTASQALVGTAAVPLGDPTPTAFDYDLCYRPSGGDTLTPFSSSQSGATLTSTDVVYTAASSKVPGAGTWDVGFCVKPAASGRDAERTNEVNGWVMVVNQ